MTFPLSRPDAVHLTLTVQLARGGVEPESCGTGQTPDLAETLESQSHQKSRSHMRWLHLNACRAGTHESRAWKHARTQSGLGVHGNPFPSPLHRFAVAIRFCLLSKGCRPFPRTPFSASGRVPPLRSGRFSLTKPNTSCTIEMPASLRSDHCSPSARNAVRVPFGISVRLRRNPHLATEPRKCASVPNSRSAANSWCANCLQTEARRFASILLSCRMIFLTPRGSEKLSYQLPFISPPDKPH